MRAHIDDIKRSPAWQPYHPSCSVVRFGRALPGGTALPVEPSAAVYQSSKVPSATFPIHHSSERTSPHHYSRLDMVHNHRFDSDCHMSRPQYRVVDAFLPFDYLGL